MICVYPKLANKKHDYLNVPDEDVCQKTIHHLVVIYSVVYVWNKKKKKTLHDGGAVLVAVVPFLMNLVLVSMMHVK
jgi:hypothetical protein